MGGSGFRFKRFEVGQAGAAMKVGTDGVLLGAWCPLDKRPRTALDIGTGTGLLALMLSQRCEGWGCAVDAVEIDEGSYRQACANIAASPWSESVTAYHSGIQGFVVTHGRKYDLVISNPPYFENSLKSPDASRTAARHTDGLSYEELLRCAEASLADEGAFAVILPHSQTEKFCALAAGCGLHLNAWTEVRPKPDAAPHRSMLMFMHTLPPSPVAPRSLTIEEGGRHEYSREYIGLTRDFYLKF